MATNEAKAREYGQHDIEYSNNKESHKSVILWLKAFYLCQYWDVLWRTYYLTLLKIFISTKKRVTNIAIL